MTAAGVDLQGSATIAEDGPRMDDHKYQDSSLSPKYALSYFIS